MSKFLLPKETRSKLTHSLKKGFFVDGFLAKSYRSGLPSLRKKHPQTHFIQRTHKSRPLRHIYQTIRRRLQQTIHLMRHTIKSQIPIRPIKLNIFRITLNPLNKSLKTRLQLLLMLPLFLLSIHIIPVPNIRPLHQIRRHFTDFNVELDVCHFSLGDEDEVFELEV